MRKVYHEVWEISSITESMSHCRCRKITQKVMANYTLSSVKSSSK